MKVADIAAMGEVVQRRMKQPPEAPKDKPSPLGFYPVSMEEMFEDNDKHREGAEAQMPLARGDVEFIGYVTATFILCILFMLIVGR